MFDQLHVSLRSAYACAYSKSDQSLSLAYSMKVKLLTEHYLEFLSLKGGFTSSSESTLVKMPHCWKSHVAAQMYNNVDNNFRVMFGLPKMAVCIVR